MSDYTREQLVTLACEHCGCPVGAQLVLIEANRLADRLWTLIVCGPCADMLKAALDLELAGGGPGGHVELHPPAHPPGRVTSSRYGRLRDARGRFRSS